MTLLVPPSDPHSTPPGRITLGKEDAMNVGMLSPSTSASDILGVHEALTAKTIDGIMFLMRDHESVLVSSLQDDTGATVFSGLWCEINSGLDSSTVVNDLDDLLKVCRYTFRLRTGLMISLCEHTDNRLCASLSMPYTHSLFKNTVICVVESCDSRKSDFVNYFPVNGFLSFVSYDDFADDARYPKDKRTRKFDMARAYGMKNRIPVCTFLPEVRTSGASTYGIRAGDIKRGQLPLFYGFDDRRTPDDFDLDKYLEIVERMLRGYNNDKKYMLFVESLQAGTAYSYVQSYEKRTTGAYNFDDLVTAIRAVSPVSFTTGRDKASYKELTMQKMNEESYIKFDREFMRLAERITGKSDVVKRSEYFEKLHEVLQRKLINDRIICPSNPDEDGAMHPSKGRPFTMEDLQYAAREHMRIHQQEKMKVNTSGNHKRLAEAMPDEKRTKKQRVRDAKTKRLEMNVNATGNTSYPKPERIKAGVGTNGSFKDGSPKTCNNCNGNDHLATECKKPADVRSKFDARLQKANGGQGSQLRTAKVRSDTASTIADSNLSKRAKADLRALLSEQRSVDPPTAAANSAGAITTAANDRSSLNGQSGLQRGATLSADRIRSILGNQ
jgi:hypothetical protein